MAGSNGLLDVYSSRSFTKGAVTVFFHLAYFGILRSRLQDPDLGFQAFLFYNQTMRNLIILLSFCSWTLAQAQSQSSSPYNSQSSSYEMTYEDLAHELAIKKREIADPSTQALGFDRIQAIFGYSFSAMDFNLESGGSAFNMSGIDIRANGQISDSAWQLEGGLKNYVRVSSGSKSAESTILTTAIKNQNYLNAHLQYVAGVATSLHWISAKDDLKSKNGVDLSLNLSAGIRGSLSQQLSWGVDINAYSPISGGILKSGVETVVLLSSVL